MITILYGIPGCGKTSYANQMKKSESKTRTMQDAVSFLLDTLPEKDIITQETILVKTKFLHDLWKAVKIKDYKYNFMEGFIHRSIALHTILRHSYDLFRKRNKTDFVNKLKLLEKACHESLMRLGYESVELPITTEELLQEYSGPPKADQDQDQE